MEKTIRILHVVTHMNRGGLETMLMNYYRCINKQKIQFDFLTHRPEGEKKDYDDEIRSLGGRIYHLPVLNPFRLSYYQEMRRFFEGHREYKIIHSHLDCMSSYPLKLAKEEGIPVRIAHAHNTSVPDNFKKYVKFYAKKRIPQFATNLFSCGQEAGEWMFEGKKFQILHNAIDTSNYKFNQKIREKKRKELGIKDDILVIGHVGSFSYAKNHGFLLKIFQDVLEQDNRVKLVLVGDGSEKANIQAQVQGNEELKDKIIFAGVRGDVNDLLQGFDVFVFPSLYEGLPVTLIEAQAAGLPCIASDNITREVQITDCIKFLSLEKSSKIWADEILNYRGNKNRSDQSSKIMKNQYDIVNNAKWLEEFYLDEYRKAMSHTDSLHTNL